jgi:hypothetical protein
MVVMGKSSDHPRLLAKIALFRGESLAQSAPAKESAVPKTELSPDEKFVKQLNRSQQLKLLAALEVKKAPNFEKDRVALLLNLFKEKPKESVKAIKELGLI